MSQLAPFLTGAFTLGGVALGFFLNGRRERTKEKTFIDNCWDVMHLEMSYNTAKVRSLLEDQVSGPLYRYSHGNFHELFPKLLSVQALDMAEKTALFTYFMEIETLNRGLDRAGAAETFEDKDAEFRRNVLKAERLRPGGSIYEAAAAVMKRHNRELPPPAKI